MTVTVASMQAVLKLDKRGFDTGLNQAKSSMTKTSAAAVGLGTAITGAFAVAGGLVVAKGVRAIVGGTTSMISQAFDATVGYERLEMALESLMAREIKRASGYDVQVQKGMAAIGLSKKEQKELDKLTASIDELQFKRQQNIDKMNLSKQALSEQTIGVKGSTVSYQRQQEAVQNQTQAANKASDAYYDAQDRIAELTKKQTELVPVMATVRKGQMSMTDAINAAQEPTKELISWTEKLAIISPFSQDDVAQSLKLGMAYLFTSDEAKDLTDTVIDYAAANGVEQMAFLSCCRGRVARRRNEAHYFGNGADARQPKSDKRRFEPDDRSWCQCSGHFGQYGLYTGRRNRGTSRRRWFL